jgi:hypothetical protein
LQGDSPSPRSAARQIFAHFKKEAAETSRLGHASVKDRHCSDQKHEFQFGDFHMKLSFLKCRRSAHREAEAMLAGPASYWPREGTSGIWIRTREFRDFD